MNDFEKAGLRIKCLELALTHSTEFDKKDSETRALRFYNFVVADTEAVSPAAPKEVIGPDTRRKTTR